MKLHKKIYFILLSLVLFVIFSSTLSCNKDSTEIAEMEEEEATEEEEITIEIEEEKLTEETGEEEEDEETLEEVEDPILVKLDEVQQLYSLEFRLYLETMGKNYMENLLADDNLIRQEYDLFKWRNTFYEDNIIFTADGNIFPSEWYDPVIDAKAESLSAGEVERSKRIIISALDKYPAQFLKYNLKNVYILKSLSYSGVSAGGTNSFDCVYIANDGVNMGYTDIIIEKEFHHEFSSIVLRNYWYIFKESAWRQSNPAGFVYFDEAGGGVGAIKEGKTSSVFSVQAHESGFLYEYAQSTLENDFNSFAENIFMGEEDFFRTVEQYEKLKMKLDLIISLYNTIHPQFTFEYFKNL
jgi:hypothetical protein